MLGVSRFVLRHKLAVGMDYEVFILTRVREERDAAGSTTAGIIGGISRTGRLVTCAALILFFATGALSTAPETDTKVMATALGTGILLDATVVRALLVPALAALLGDWNWWLPGWARKLLRVPAEAGPAPAALRAPASAGPGTAADPHPAYNSTNSEVSR